MQIDTTVRAMIARGFGSRCLIHVS